jgi:tetratricopeptide (TPR) repeat protein
MVVRQWHRLKQWAGSESSHSQSSSPHFVSDEAPLSSEVEGPMPQIAVVDRLHALPSPNTNEFLVATRELAAELGDADETLETVIGESSLAEQARFNALYLLLFRLRRRRDYHEYRQWVDRYRLEFSKFPLFHTFEVVYQRSLGEDRRSMEQAIRESGRALEELPDFPGVLHQYAELVASSSERHGNIATEDLERAVRSARRAIALSDRPQPHFWSTLARLQAALGDYSSARRSIAEAIELEPSEGQDYALRQTENLLIEARVYFAEAQARSAAREEEARNELTEVRTQLLQLLGLLAAIIAFLTTSVTVARTGDTSFAEKTRMLLITGGVIVLTFTAFSFCFNVANIRRLWPPALLSLLLIAGGIWYDALVNLVRT